MTLRQPHEDPVVTAEEAAVIRRALAACSRLLAWAGQNCGPEYRAAVADASQAAGLGRSPSGLAHDVALSIDYLDFAPAARRTR